MENTVQAAASLRVGPNLPQQFLSNGVLAAEVEDPKWLLYAEASAFLKREAARGTTRRLCILEAKTENIIGATPAWLEATGLTWSDIETANASSGSGIRNAVATTTTSTPTADTAGGGGGGGGGRQRRAPPAELLKFLILDKPDDILVPEEVATSSQQSSTSLRGRGDLLGPRPRTLYQNLAAAFPQKTMEFSEQWHKAGGYTYTGFTTVSRMFFHKKDGTDVAAYLLNLRKAERAYPVPGKPIVWLRPTFGPGRTSGRNEVTSEVAPVNIN